MTIVFVICGPSATILPKIKMIRYVIRLFAKTFTYKYLINFTFRKTIRKHVTLDQDVSKEKKVKQLHREKILW